MCATQLFVIYAKHTKTTKSTTKTVIKLVNHAATSLVLLPNTHTPFWFSCGHLAWFARMVMRVMTLMHMFEMTLALGLGTSLVTLWRVWTPLQYMQTAQHNRPPWSCEIRGLRDADELIVLGFFLKVSHFTFRMIFCALLLVTYLLVTRPRSAPADLSARRLLWQFACNIRMV